MVAILVVVVMAQNFTANEFASPLIVLCGLFVALFTFGRNDQNYLKFGWPLIVVFVIGLHGVFNHESRHVIRDLIFALSPLSLSFIGYWIAGNAQLRKSIFKILLVCGFLLATYHLSAFVDSPELLLADVEVVREKAGKGTGGLVAIGLAISLFQYRLRIGKLYPKLLPRLVVIPVLVVSFVLSYSRTEFLMFLILILALSGWLSTIRLSTVLGLVGLCFASLIVVATTPDDESGTIRSKFTRSLTEVSTTSFVDDADIHGNWRAFETNRALGSFSSSTVLEQVLGQGFGALVDIGLEMKLGIDVLRDIPILHNGYAYILIKTGMLGILLYILFYISLIRFAVRNANSIDVEKKFYSRLLLGCVLSLMLMMSVLGGMAETSGPAFVLLLGYLVRRLGQLQRKTSPDLLGNTEGNLAAQVGDVGRYSSWVKRRAT